MTIENDVEFERGMDRFNLRTAAVIVREGRLLVQRQTTDGFYFLPGGRVGFQETSEEAIRRELDEELGAEIEIERLLWIAENFFTIRDRNVHEICYYWFARIDETTLPDDSPALTESFKVYDGGPFEFRWVPLEEVPETPLRPDFLRERISSLPESTQIVVQREGAKDD